MVTDQVYDVRKLEDKRVLESTFTSGKHSDAVWEVVWVDKGSERGEALVSVSSDGRVSLWTMSKGLENSDLIKLKRLASHKKAAPAAQQANTKKEAFISRLPPFLVPLPALPPSIHPSFLPSQPACLPSSLPLLAGITARCTWQALAPSCGAGAGSP